MFGKVREVGASDGISVVKGGRRTEVQGGLGV